MSAAVMASPAPRFGGNSNNATSNSAASISPSVHRSAPTPRSNSGSPSAGAKASPPSANTSRNAGAPPKIIVKTEPGSPNIPATRHRPRKLDLSKNITGNSPATGRPLTSRADSGGLGIQEMGLACLSPGFVTQDPVMKEQLQRSISVREQQRHIIEARLQQQSAKGDGNMSMTMNMNVDSSRADKGPDDISTKTPGFQSRRNKAPPGLSIVAPSHEHFANERVIQSAPLGQTFTGMHNHPHPLSRHIENRPSKLSNTSHIHHVPATQTNNRLPPIADVFGQGLSGHPHSEQHSMYANQTAPHRAPLSSPSHPPQQQMPTPGGRPREYKSAEEAQQELSGGRPELLPKLVHYGGHQPPTPPSPLPGGHRIDASRSISTSTKRRREEYEHGISPPLGNGRPAPRLGPFGESRDSPETNREKKDEFIRLCERAWDLFHS